MSKALDFARMDEFEVASRHFEGLLLSYPQICKMWVAYAQMEKRRGRMQADNDAAYHRARSILQRGMTYNPTSACIAQTWGLTELQRGNIVGAVKLLERSVKLDPANNPVMRWQPIQQALSDAYATIGTRRKTVRNRKATLEA